MDDERDHSRLKSEEKEEPPKLDWKDYVAFVIALLETALLPFILFIGILILIVVVLSLTKTNHALILYHWS